MDTKTVNTNTKEPTSSDKLMRVAIASGKGGTGKTFVATNLFFSLLQHGEKVSLVDCDAEEPNVCLFFPRFSSVSDDVMQWVPVIDTEKCTFCMKCHDWCNYNAIFAIPPAGIIHVIDDLCHSCGACTYACEFDAIHEKEVCVGSVTECTCADDSIIIETRTKTGVYSPVPVIKAGIAKSSPSGLVIFDSPPGTSCPFIQTVARVDYVVLVTEPTPYGLSDLRQSVDTLRDMNKPFGVVVNRSGIGNDEVYQYLKKEEILLLLDIPFNKRIASEYAQGKVFAEGNLAFQTEMLKMFQTLKNDLWK